MYGCDSWTIKSAECWRIDAFVLWCWRRFLRGPWTARSNQSILKEISSRYSLEGVMLKHQLLATWWEKNWFIGSDPDAGKNWRQEKGMREDEMVGRHCWHNGHELEQAPRVGDGQWSLACYSPWDRRTGHDWVTELRGKRTITYRGGYAMGWNLSRISKGQDGEMAFLHAER